jgi:hypothetical protein
MPPPQVGVVELRQYTMKPGGREVLTGMFERIFIREQAACGLHVLGVFADADRPDRFVWLRGCRDMAARGLGMHAFYDGPVWRHHRAAANATMVDASYVLMLKPVTAWPAWPRDGEAATWTATVFRLAAEPDDVLRQRLRASGLAWLETEPADNNFPRHAMRRGEWVVVSLLRGEAALPADLTARLPAPLQVLRLQPAACSPMR